MEFSDFTHVFFFNFNQYLTFSAVKKGRYSYEKRAETIMQSRTYWHNRALEEEGHIPSYEMAETSKPLVLTLPGQMPAVLTQPERFPHYGPTVPKAPKVPQLPAQSPQQQRQTAAIPSIETFRKSEATESATQAVLSAISAQSGSGETMVTPAELIARLQEHYGYNTALMIADLCKKARESVLQGSVPLEIQPSAAAAPGTSQGSNVLQGNPYATPGGIQMAQSPGEMSDDSGVSLMSPSAAYSAPASANSLPPVSPYMPAGAPPASPYTPHSALPTQSASAEAMYPVTPAENQMTPAQATVPIQGPETSGNVVEVVPGKVHSINMTRQIIIDGQPISYLLEGVLVTPSDEEQEEQEQNENNGIKSEFQKRKTTKSSRRSSSDSNETTLAEEMSIDGQPLVHLLKNVLNEVAEEQNVSQGKRIKEEVVKERQEVSQKQAGQLEVTSGDSPFPIIQKPAPSVVNQIVIDGQPVLNLFDNMTQGTSNRTADPMQSMQNTVPTEQIASAEAMERYPMQGQNHAAPQNFGSMIQEVVNNTPTNYENTSMYGPVEQNVMVQGNGGVGPSPSDIQETAETLINLAQSMPIDNCQQGSLPGTSGNITSYNSDHSNPTFLNALLSDQQVGQ